MRSLLKDTRGVVDLGVVLMIGIAFAALKNKVFSFLNSLFCADGVCLYRMDT